MMDIEHHMLHFLDNHDEQRLASPQFAGDAEFGRPAMLVSALLSSSPTMISARRFLTMWACPSIKNG